MFPRNTMMMGMRSRTVESGKAVSLPSQGVRAPAATLHPTMWKMLAAVIGLVLGVYMQTKLRGVGSNDNNSLANTRHLPPCDPPAAAPPSGKTVLQKCAPVPCPGAPKTASSKSVLQMGGAREKSGCAMSMRESDGFYCMSDDEWNMRREIARVQAPKQCENKLCCIVKDHWRSWYWYHFEAEWSCVETRVGALGEDGKWMCDLDVIEARSKKTNKPCLVYSFGAKNDFGFEEAIHERLPNCEIFSFDPMLKEKNPSAKSPSFVKFQPWGLGNEDKVVQGAQYFKLDSIMNKLGHGEREVDIFKVDIDGDEYAAFDGGVLGTGAEHKIRTMQIEMHDAQKNGQFMLDLRRAGFLVYHKEANYAEPKNLHEMGFVRVGREFLNSFDDPLASISCT